MASGRIRVVRRRNAAEKVVEGGASLIGGDLASDRRQACDWGAASGEDDLFPGLRTADQFQKLGFCVGYVNSHIGEKDIMVHRDGPYWTTSFQPATGGFAGWKPAVH